MKQAPSVELRPRHEGASFLPDFCSVRMVFTVVITAELLAMILVLGSGVTAQRLWQQLSLYSLFIQWIALGSAAVLCLLRGKLQSMRNGAAGVAALMVLLLVTAVISELAAYWMDELGHYRLFDPDGHFGLTLKSLGISAIVGALMLRYFYMQHLWRKQMEAESESRFQALQSRIRPHFLFNSMNTIASLTRTDPPRAEEVVADLADLFRVSLREATRDTTLGDELDITRRYLNIERLRLGDRLQVEWDLQDLPEQAPLPALVLQPLLENAVYHGVEPALEPGRIRVSGRYRRGWVNLSVRNSIPATENSSQRKGHHLALENTRQRLAARFDGEARLIESRIEGDFQVRLVFPFPWTGR